MNVLHWIWTRALAMLAFIVSLPRAHAAPAALPRDCSTQAGSGSNGNFALQHPSSSFDGSREMYVNAVVRLPAQGGLAVNEDVTYVGFYLQQNSENNVTVTVNIQGSTTCLAWRSQGDVQYDDCTRYTLDQITYDVRCNPDPGTVQDALVCAFFHGDVANHHCAGFGQSSIVQQGDCDPQNAQVGQLWQLRPASD